MAERGDFYEDDEPIEMLELAFERGRHVVSELTSGNPSNHWNVTIPFPEIRPAQWSRLGDTQAAVTR